MNYLLLNATYIYDTIFDTSQLSVIRGTSTLLKRAVEHIRKAFKGRLGCLSSGASSGLFEVNESEDLHTITEEVRNGLAADVCYRTLNFTVVAAQANSVEHARGILFALAGRQQLDSFSQVPDLADSLSCNGTSVPCGLSGVRIADSKDRRSTVGSETLDLSSNCKARLDFGRKERRQFFKRELGAECDLATAKSLESLTACPLYSKLGNKMAVIYLDGNRFTAIQKEMIRSDSSLSQAEAQKCFDRLMQKKRRELLRIIYDRYTTNSANRFTDGLGVEKNENGEDESFLRFECLLWGGDELIIVVPAWLGFDLLHGIYSHTRLWHEDEEVAKFKLSALTHAGGIVFCNRKTPISEVMGLANSLADDRVKAWRSGDTHGRAEDYFDYLVLESIDYPAEKSLDQHMIERFGDITKKRRPLRAAADWMALRTALEGVYNPDVLSSRLLHQMAKCVTTTGVCELGSSVRQVPVWTSARPSKSDIESFSAFETLEWRITKTARVDDFSRRMEPITAYFCDDPNDLSQRALMWLHLVELKDYLLPERDS